MRGSDAARQADEGRDGAGVPERDLCRVADLEIFPAGDGLSLVYARDSGAAGFYRADVLGLLTGCREFATPGEHIRNYLGSDVSPAREAALRRELTRLRGAGFLLTVEGLRQRGGSGDGSLPPISTICIPTADRPALLRRAISGYVRNCARFGRHAEVIVADDSPGPAVRQACRVMLRDLGRRAGIGIRYAGLEEKTAFVARLASAGNIPEDVVRFGCLGDGGHGVTIGANRNVLLLQSAGERILTADDDTVCDLAIPPEHTGGIAVEPGGNPLQLWFFPSRAAAFAAARSADEDLLGWHGRYLGREPAPLLTAAGLDAFKRCDPALLRRMLSGSGRIRVTANGVAGDCGWDNRDFCLFQDDATFARLARSAAGYAMARASREMIQSVTQATITAQADPRFAMCLGLDNTDLLPPFPPSGRAEEVTFGALLAACSGAYAAHLPLLVHHDPAGVRHFPDVSPFVISLGSWLPACTGRFDPGFAASPASRLRAFGNFVTDLARLPPAAFDEFARLVMWDSMGALTCQLEERLAGTGPVPAYWVRDARRFMARARRAAIGPADELYAAIGGRSALQDLLGRFGQLLIWWPAMVETARELRAAGEHLAQPPQDVTIATGAHEYR